MLKKPLVAINRISVAVHNINQRIQLKKRNQLIVVEHVDVPQNRSRPHPHLQPDVDDLCKVPEKHHDCTTAIAHGKNQHKQAETVINHLYGIDIGIIAVKRRDHQKHRYEEKMNKGSGNQLNNRKNADIKHYLFYQIAVLKQSIGSVCDCL